MLGHLQMPLGFYEQLRQCVPSFPPGRQRTVALMGRRRDAAAASRVDGGSVRGISAAAAAPRVHAEGCSSRGGRGAAVNAGGRSLTSSLGGPRKDIKNI